MRALKGGIPRGYKDHRRADALRYKAYCLAVQASGARCRRWRCPRCARPAG